MANTSSAEKRNRQTHKRRARNLHLRAGIKSAVKKAREAIARGDAAESRQALLHAARVLDRAASSGIVHRNAASRRISRLAKTAAKVAKAAPA